MRRESSRDRRNHREGAEFITTAISQRCGSETNSPLYKSFYPIQPASGLCGFLNMYYAGKIVGAADDHTNEKSA